MSVDLVERAVGLLTVCQLEHLRSLKEVPGENPVVQREEGGVEHDTDAGKGRLIIDNKSRDRTRKLQKVAQDRKLYVISQLRILLPLDQKEDRSDPGHQQDHYHDSPVDMIDFKEQIAHLIQVLDMLLFLARLLILVHNF